MISLTEMRWKQYHLHNPRISPKGIGYFGWLILVLIFLIPFTFPIIGSKNIGGVSLRYIRDIIVMTIMISIILLSILSLRGRIILPKMSRMTIITWFLFGIYFSASSLYSENILNSIKYAPKYIYPTIFSLAVIQSRKIDAVLYYKVIIYSIILYLFSSIFLHLGGIINTPYLEGFSGRHFTKFIALTGALIAFSNVMNGNLRKETPILGLLSMIALYLVLQRGALIALFFGSLSMIITVNLKMKKEIIGSGLLVIVSLIGFSLIFTSERFISYAFYQGMTPSYVISRLSQGDMTLLRDRGRLEHIETAMNSVDPSWFGAGIGTIPTVLGRHYGVSNYELHNDILLIWLEAGYVGFSIFVMAVILTFHWAIVGIRRQKGIHREIFRVSLGLFTGCIIWMGISNVWSYSSVSITTVLVLLSIASPRIMR